MEAARTEPDSANLPRAFEGRTVAEAQRVATRELGGEVEVISVSEEEKEGGWNGFFEKRRVTILARLISPARSRAFEPLSETDEDGDLLVDISPESRRLAAELSAAVTAPVGEDEETPEETPEKAPFANAIPFAELHLIDASKRIDASGQATPASTFDYRRFAEDLGQRLARGESIDEAVEVMEAVEAVAEPLSFELAPDPPAAEPPPIIQVTASRLTMPLEVSPTLSEQLVSSGIDAGLAAEIMAEVSLLGKEGREARTLARTLLARRLSTTPSRPLSKLQNILVVGSRGSGRSSLTGQLALALSASGRRIAVVSIGSTDDAGVESVRQAAASAGVFFSWAAKATDTTISALSREVDVLLIDMDKADPLFYQEEIDALRQAVRGRLSLVATAPTSELMPSAIERLAHYPTLYGVAVTFADSSEAEAHTANLAALQKRPVIFSAASGAALSLLDPFELATSLLP